MTPRKIRVLIVEDSSVVRELLTEIVSADPRFAVAGAATSGEEAVEAVHRLAPDVVSMDVRLPGMDGVEATRRIMSERPTPVVIVSAALDQSDVNVTMEALRAGALAVVEKPSGPDGDGFWREAERIRTQLAIMSEVRLVRHRFPRAAAPGAAPPQPARPEAGRRYSIVGIVASTGGPAALVSVLGALGGSFSLPVLVVQHMSPPFHDGFVSWLRSVSPLPATTARDGEAPLPGRVYVAPPDRHLALRAGRLKLVEEDPVDGQRPSGTALFRSLAREAGSGAIGVLLTGMGEDGAAGLLALKRAGGYTIAEDESTAVVYGMPGAAARLGAACEILPLVSAAARVAELAPRSP